MARKPNIKKHTIDELNQLFSEGESADQEVFAEMRSNVMLYAGDHYTRKGSKFWDRIKDSKDVSETQKIRLTRNHTQFIVNQYIENILGSSPSAKAMPKNPSEVQDQKAAEMNDAVLQDAREKYRLSQKSEDLCSDFVKIGECHLEQYFDPALGKFVGYHQQVDEDGQPVFDENGQPAAGDDAKFTGGFKFNRVYGFNIIRDASAKKFEESPFLCVREMVQVADLKAKLGDDKEKIKMIEENSSDETFLVFDASNASYGKSQKGQTMLRRFYFRPCPRYPRGWYYITTKAGVLWDGELPFGIFPIESETYMEIETSCRGRSPIRNIRPYQAEINRKASKMAEHQVTLGDDKIVTQMGTKITQGGILPGVRGIQVSGPNPTILPGRSGDQYLESMIQDISELYQVMGVVEDGEEKGTQLDPMAMLWRQLRQKKRFARFGKKFEGFTVRWHQLHLELAREYLTDEEVIYATGSKERVNISEFKNSTPLCYQIKVVPVGEDLESMMGKQLTLNNILQYAGSQMKPEDIGRIIKSMPFANAEEVFSDLTINYECAKNMILALDRGDMPEVNQYDDIDYMIKRLVKRTREPDFQYKPIQIRKNYEMQIMTYEEIKAQQLQALQMAQAGFIPTGGFLVKCDFYVPDPANPAKTIRATVPSESLTWLFKKIEQQGTSLDQLQDLERGARAEIMSQNGASQPPAALPATTDGAGAPPTGQTSPEGLNNEVRPPVPQP